MELPWMIGFIFFTKILKTLAEHVDSAIDVDYRVSDLLRAVEWLHAIQHDLRCLNLRPSSEMAKLWHELVHELHTNAQSIKTQKHLCSSLDYFGLCRIGKQADRGLKQAKELATDGNGLLQEARQRIYPYRT
jgi:phosphoglycerate-specific signal transduction histidine kinase